MNTNHCNRRWTRVSQVNLDYFSRLLQADVEIWYLRSQSSSNFFQKQRHGISTERSNLSANHSPSCWQWMGSSGPVMLPNKFPLCMCWFRLVKRRITGRWVIQYILKKSSHPFKRSSLTSSEPSGRRLEKSCLEYKFQDVLFTGTKRCGERLV